MTRKIQQERGEKKCVGAEVKEYREWIPPKKSRKEVICSIVQNRSNGI